MTTETYMTKEQREAKEEAELRAAEEALMGTDGTQERAPQPTVEPQEPPKEPEVDWQKRYKDLQSYHDKSTNELKDKLREAGVEPEETDKVAELEKQLADLQERESQRETLDLVTSAQEAVANAHPDYVAVISSPEFPEWIKEQPEVYQHAIYDDRPDARLSIDALTLFKTQSGFAQRQRQQEQRQVQDQAAMSVSGGHREVPQTDTKKVWTWAEIQSLTPSQYDKLEAEIDAAMQEGRVI